MADVQIEDGYTKIANELLEALLKINLSNYEFRVFMAILRKTYGYHKKGDWLSLSQLSKLTGIQTPNICRTVKKLMAKNMLIKNGKITGIQKDYDHWNIIHTDSIQIDNTIIQADNKKLSIQTDTKERKKLIQKKRSNALNGANREKEWNRIKEKREDDYKYTPIPEEAKEIIKRIIPGYGKK